MDKRYQVFVSSTFKDLEEERDTAVQTLMKIDSIPAGMELFPAADIDQFEYIKTIIDGSDYYVLIIGGKYGTVTEEGVSYTEKEYDYALEKNIPVLAFLHKNPDKITAKNSERTQEAIDKLNAFRNKASNGRLVEFWENKDQLASQIIIGMTKATKMFPRVGWVRADKVSSIESLSEINELRKKNDELELKLQGLSLIKTDEGILNEALNSVDLCNLSEKIKLPATLDHKGEKLSLPITVSLSEVFNLLATEITQPTEENQVQGYLIDNLQSKVTDTYTAFFKFRKSIIIPFNFLFRCRIHFIALKLMNIKTEFEDGETKHYWQLTDNGTVEMLKTMAFTHEGE